MIPWDFHLHFDQAWLSITGTPRAKTQILCYDSVCFRDNSIPPQKWPKNSRVEGKKEKLMKTHHLEVSWSNPVWPFRPAFCWVFIIPSPDSSPPGISPNTTNPKASDESPCHVVETSVGCQCGLPEEFDLDVDLEDLEKRRLVLKLWSREGTLEKQPPKQMAENEWITGVIALYLQDLYFLDLFSLWFYPIGFIAMKNHDLGNILDFSIYQTSKSKGIPEN